jgi:hypothetical protein
VPQTRQRLYIVMLRLDSGDDGTQESCSTDSDWAIAFLSFSICRGSSRPTDSATAQTKPLPSGQDKIAKFMAECQLHHKSCTDGILGVSQSVLFLCWFRLWEEGSCNKLMMIIVKLQRACCSQVNDVIEYAKDVTVPSGHAVHYCSTLYSQSSLRYSFINVFCFTVKFYFSEFVRWGEQ